MNTDSTHPPAGLFTRSASTIARTLASKRLTERAASGMRMLTYFMNRARRGLNAERRAELGKARDMLSTKIEQQRKEQQRKVRKRKTRV